MECVLADSVEVFVEDDALEGGAFDEYQIFDDFELFGESDIHEGEAILECCLSYFRNVAVLTEYCTHEMGTGSEHKLRNALKIRTSTEVNSKEEGAHAEGLLSTPTNYSEAGSSPAYLYGTI